MCIFPLCLLMFFFIVFFSSLYRSKFYICFVRIIWKGQKKSIRLPAFSCHLWVLTLIASWVEFMWPNNCHTRDRLTCKTTKFSNYFEYNVENSLQNTINFFSLIEGFYNDVFKVFKLMHFNTLTECHLLCVCFSIDRLSLTQNNLTSEKCHPESFSR